MAGVPTASQVGRMYVFLLCACKNRNARVAIPITGIPAAISG